MAQVWIEHPTRRPQTCTQSPPVVRLDFSKHDRPYTTNSTTTSHLGEYLTVRAFSHDSTGRILTGIVYLPAEVQGAINPDLAAFGDKVLSKQVLDWVADAEKNTPYLRTWYYPPNIDAFG